MRISSNNYDYYNQAYSLNSLSNAKVSATNSDFSKTETEAISFQPRKYSSTDQNANIMNLSSSGRMMRDSLQMQDAGSSEMSEKMEKIRTDMDSIKSADIDSMSADELKETLTNLQTDMAAIPSRDGRGNDIQQADISSMSETDMKDMLEKIQEHAKNMPEMGEGMPPPPPPKNGGFDASQILNGILGGQDEDTSSLNASNDMQSIVQQIADKLIESYKSSSEESSDDYVEKLKDSLSSMFSQQKNSIDDFSNMIFNKLDAWNSEEKTKTDET